MANCDEEFRKAITAYAQSGGEWVSKEVMERWIEVQVNDADCKLPKMFRAFHAKHGRYPTHAEIRDELLPPGGPIVVTPR
jgi:hypothetical protein